MGVKLLGAGGAGIHGSLASWNGQPEGTATASLESLAGRE